VRSDNTPGKDIGYFKAEAIQLCCAFLNSALAIFCDAESKARPFSCAAPGSNGI